MNDTTTRQASNIVLEYDIDAPPEKIWRAVSIPDFREKWLPEKHLAEPDPLSCVPGEEVCYRMRDDSPPFLESIVKFQVRPNTDGGTRLRIQQDLVDRQLRRHTPPAANGNWSPRMLAA
jgi:uncharacterized protein YndB with AHSA1/START domain